MTKLTILEKKKLEDLVSEMISESRGSLDEYSLRREDMEDILKSVPVKATKLLAEFERLSKSEKEVEIELEALGFDINTCKQVPTLQVRDEHPTLVSRKAVRDEKRKKLEKLRKEFVVKIYSGDGGMEAILAEFTSAINKI